MCVPPPPAVYGASGSRAPALVSFAVGGAVGAARAWVRLFVAEDCACVSEGRACALCCALSAHHRMRCAAEQRRGRDAVRRARAHGGWWSEGIAGMMCLREVRRGWRSTGGASRRHARFAARHERPTNRGGRRSRPSRRVGARDATTDVYPPRPVVIIKNAKRYIYIIVSRESARFNLRGQIVGAHTPRRSTRGHARGASRSGPVCFLLACMQRAAAAPLLPRSVASD